jgi:hypothetical protein
MHQIAVCLRGEVRNWNYTKDAVFKFYEGIALSVDYYYATWDVPYINQDELNVSFAGQELIQGVLCPSGNDRRRWGSRLGPAFLSSNIKLNKKYDLVIDTRFDSVPIRRPNAMISLPDDAEIQTAYLRIDNVWETGGTNDRWAIMQQDTFNQFNNRLPLLYESWKSRLTQETHPTMNEMELERVLKKINISPIPCTWMDNFLVRPSIIDIFPKSTNITMVDYATVHENINFWDSLTSNQKIDYCTKQSIHIKDYGL